MQAEGSTIPRLPVIKGGKHEWEMVIGLEVHAQIASQAKLFSRAPTTFGAEPNTQVSLVDAAMPGMLPILNEHCVAQAVRTGLGLGAKINLLSAFDRKNYFYPDLPQGYQISQLYSPLVSGGEVLLELAPGVTRRVRIERIHIEQDAGKSIHDMDPELSFVDLNRTGVALMEIVSFPDMRGPGDAAACLAKLRQIMRYLGTCDGNMQNGSLRADVNLSVCRPGQYEAWLKSGDYSKLETRCEIKNMNSLRFVQAAIDYEAKRQVAIHEAGGTVEQETRLFDPATGSTRSMRSKEEAHDYRYFPDPDLLPLELEQEWVDEMAASLPELPDARKARFMDGFGLSAYDAEILTAEPARANYFEQVACGVSGKLAANWVINDLMGHLRKDGKEITESPVSPAQLAAIIGLIEGGEITGKTARELFERVYSDGGDPKAIVDERGMRQVNDTSAIDNAIETAIAQKPDLAGKVGENPKLVGWFVGQVMKATQGRANPQEVNARVRARLGI